MQAVPRCITPKTAVRGFQIRHACIQVAKVHYKGPFDVMKHVRAEKGMLGLYKGFTPTLVREVNGNAVMFGVYEYLKRQLASAQVQHPS